MDKVNYFFTQEMSRTLQQIPVSKHGGDDFISWPHAKFGQYTVKSVYNLARTEKFFSKRSANDQGDSSDLPSQEKHWKSIWSITLPEKMKIVIWRMVHDRLPTSFQLQRRNIPAEDQCVFCGRSERVEHIFLFCPFAQSVWDVIKNHGNLKLCLKSFSNMKQWIFDFLDRASQLQSTFLASLGIEK
jgi:hypothetical protein